ncbi:UNVERIFIED_ORG: PAS domain S-box-containing protein [Heyndrickxia coagulans]
METEITIRLRNEHSKMLDSLLQSMGGNAERLFMKLIEDRFYALNNESMREKEDKHVMIDGFALGDEISDGICVTDDCGIVLRVNKAYTRITGIAENEIVGRPVQFLRKKFNNPVTEKVLKEKKKISAMSTVANNKKVLLTGTPILNEHGELIQVYTIMRDLTEMMMLKEQLEEKEKESERYTEALKLLNERKKQSNFIGQSSSMINIKRLIEQVSHTDATVLITGETGSGKEVIANEIFRNSTRKDHPFIKVNCAAIPETLLESELFGYEKGAFTGAQQKAKPGLLEMAHKGTILLDEIGEMPMKLQSKLLRCLQEQEITRVGGTKPIKLDIRVIAATNQNLQKQIKNGFFREDLYYRLNVIPIQVPPLKERKEDIYLLAHHFLEKFNKKYKKHKMFEAGAVDILASYPWPGNVRELENMIERLVIIRDEKTIEKEDVATALGETNSSAKRKNQIIMPLKAAVENLERDMIIQALKKYGSTHKAAKILGVAQPTVVRKAKALGIKQW